MRYLFATLVVSTGLMAIAAKVECATIVVAAGGSVQRAIDDAQPGATILLQAGATFSGTIVLPNKSGNAVITIRSSASDAALPPAGSRIDPSYAPVLPKLRSGSSMPALMTAAGAHDYNLAALEFLPNAAGAGDIIELGDGSSKQLTLAASSSWAMDRRSSSRSPPFPTISCSIASTFTAMRRPGRNAPSLSTAPRRPSSTPTSRTSRPSVRIHRRSEI